MTYLELCQALQREAGIPGTQIDDVENQTGEFLRVVSWVSLAWQEIQASRKDWSFRWVEEEVIFTSGSQDQDFLTAIGEGDVILSPEPWIITHSTNQKRRLEYLEPMLFRQSLGDLAVNAGIPSRFTILPDQTVRLDVEPDATFYPITVNFRYQAEIQELAVSDDIPSMLPRYHNAILYLALQKYADFEEADQLWKYANRNYEVWFDMMVRDLLPRPLIGADALA